MNDFADRHLWPTGGSDAPLRAVLEQAPLAIVFIGTAGEILFRNAMFDKLWGHQAHNKATRIYSDDDQRYHLDGRPVASEEWPGARAVLKGEVVEDEVLEIVQTSGRRFFCWFAASPIRDEAGRISGGVVLLRDVSEERRTQEVLTRGREEMESRFTERTFQMMTAEDGFRQAQKMEAVGQLTGGIAHDFNNMLQGVTGALDMARRRMQAGRLDDAARYIDAGRDAAARAAGLTQRLLAFARRRPLDPRLVDADASITGMADLIRRTVGPGIMLDLRLRDGAGRVLCDAGELESALLNLCINARDAMPEGGRLTVGTEDVWLSAADVPDGEAGAGPYVVVTVADTGIGMASDVRARVFEPFFTTKPHGEGTGLGLSQVWGFARQLGGVARIESVPGRGTTVRLLLPLHEGATPEDIQPGPAPPPPTGAGGTVLLVEDQDAIRGPAADRLRELGHTVLEARDGPEALRILASARPDLMVTDVGLPNGMNGQQVAEAARERVPGLPVLFISGNAGTALPPGMEVIDKPFDLDTLARRVEARLLAHRSGAAGAAS
ncbi:ATP-binding protein [Falsiroseomonas tokyonensis]|uniref:histidine kinase n=1 Tax=Falsiroseomonas tokyonensis TaxID=430521 RepID=A0ABV7BW45_9PROT|nr:response regulator [Falsiroseomonas tokyonensis]